MRLPLREASLSFIHATVVSHLGSPKLQSRDSTNHLFWRDPIKSIHKYSGLIILMRQILSERLLFSDPLS